MHESYGSARKTQLMSNQSTCPDPAVLNQAMLGQLSEAKAEAVERHLLSCERCLESTSALQASDTLIPALRQIDDVERQQAGLEAGVARVKERLQGQPTGAFDSGSTPFFNLSTPVVGPTFDVMSLLAPAEGPVDLTEAARRLNLAYIRPASEREVAELFPGCEVDAVCPLGRQYQMPVIVDESLAANSYIAFKTGSHRDAVRMRYEDFQRLSNAVTCAITSVARKAVAV